MIAACQVGSVASPGCAKTQQQQQHLMPPQQLHPGWSDSPPPLPSASITASRRNIREWLVNGQMLGSWQSRGGGGGEKQAYLAFTRSLRIILKAGLSQRPRVWDGPLDITGLPVHLRPSFAPTLARRFERRSATFLDHTMDKAICIFGYCCLWMSILVLHLVKRAVNVQNRD